MKSVALIGADGAGKTTIAERLRRSFPRPMKYLYMGINIESSNVALPTSRLLERVKKLKQGKSDSKQSSASLHNREATLKKGLLKNVWLFIRLFNRLAEEWYCQLLSWIYRRRGFMVLYDRHFLFDFEKNGTNGAQQRLPLAERIHRWCLLQNPAAFKKLKNQLYGKTWVTFCKHSFGGPEQVLEYLSRYTHRVAVSNHRLIKVENGRVYFKWKNYRKDGMLQETSLEVFEFIRRFLLHVLPKGYFKIRYYGILASRNRPKLWTAQEILGVAGGVKDEHPQRTREKFRRVVS